MLKQCSVKYNKWTKTRMFKETSGLIKGKIKKIKINKRFKCGKFRGLHKFLVFIMYNIRNNYYNHLNISYQNKFYFYSYRLTVC